MQGHAFLGKQQTPAQPYAYGFRGRMDERIDLCRTVRDKQYRYIRNYMPHKIYGQYIDYLWKAPSMRSWDAAREAGTLTETQRKFWETKPAEELFDVAADPHNVRNLAGDPRYKATLDKLRKANRDWLVKSKDVGFLPEAMVETIAQREPLYTYARSKQYNQPRILETADMASLGTPANLPELTRRLTDNDAVIRYWAATGCTVLGLKAQPAMRQLTQLLGDPEISVRIAAAEALAGLGEHTQSVQTLTDALVSDDQMARVQALSVLDKLGPAAKPALPTVRKVAQGTMKNADYDVNAAKRLLARVVE